MAAMTSAFDVRRVAGWFRLIAFAEALSWVGLLVGMYFKYLSSPQTEIGVKVFGPVHGGIFIAFLVAVALVGIAHKWGLGTWLLALLASIVPFGSVIFLIWADRKGRIGAVSAPAGAVTVTRAGTASDAGQPGRSVPETT
jgi:integral membrane protein